MSDIDYLSELILAGAEKSATLDYKRDLPKGRDGAGSQLLYSNR